jgi:hypothetical protein
MKNIFSALIAAATIIISVSSCTKSASEDPTPFQIPTGKFRVEFEHLVGTEALAFNTANTQYTNNVSETFNVTMLKYYVSNVVLTRTDNSKYKLPKSYYLVDASSAEASLLSFNNIPVGNYKSMSFVLGVDSTHNVSGSQKGALDPANGMFWSWNNGYIFFKIEGTSPQSTATDNVIAYHIGGFKNSDHTNALKTIEIPFNTSVLSVGTVGNPQVHLSVDVSEVLKTPNDISFATSPTCHMPGSMAKSIASNYVDMFTFEHIHN